MRLTTILTSLLSCILTFAFSQERNITGKIIDAENVPIFAANIYIPSGDRGTLSNVDGSFQLAINNEKEFVVSYLGYHTDTINITAQKYYEITLRLNNNLGPGVLIYDEKYSRQYNYSTIPLKEIKTTPVLSQQTVYNSIPGVYMFAGAPNTNKLTIRGIGSRSPFSTSKIRSYINNVPITTGIGESNLEDINLDFIDKIQITKGPSAPEFGSSLGGVIHYKTIAQSRDKINLSSNTSYGSFNTLKTNANYKYSNKNMFFALNQDVLTSDGYRENNAYKRYTTSGFAQVENDEDILTVFVNLTQLKAEIPSFLTETDFHNNPSIAAPNWQSVDGYEDYRRNQVSITHTRELSDKWKTDITGFLSTFENYERRPFNVLTQNNTSIGTRSQLTYGLNDGNQWKIGLEYFNEREALSTYETTDDGAGDILSDNFERRNFINIYSQGNYTWNRFGVTAGLNFNTTFYTLEDRFVSNGNQSGKYSYDPILSPFLSLYYKPRNAGILYFNIAHGFSAPTLEETLTPDGVINPNIKAETGWNIEMGLRRKYKGYEVDASIYTLSANNLLVSQVLPDDNIIRLNAGRTLHPGIEVALSKRYILKAQDYTPFISWSISYNFAPHRFLEFDEGNEDYSGNFLPGNPMHKLHLQLNSAYKNFNIKLTNNTVSSMYRDDANENKVNGYSLLNALLSYDIIRKKNWSLQINSQINNIFNTKHASMFIINPRSFGGNAPRYLYPGLPRNYFAGLKIQYKI